MKIFKYFKVFMFIKVFKYIKVFESCLEQVGPTDPKKFLA